MSDKNTTSTHLCAKCSKTEEKMYRCARCRNIFYCSRECQRQHWKNHKKICVEFKNIETQKEQSNKSNSVKQSTPAVVEKPLTETGSNSPELQSSSIDENFDGELHELALQEYNKWRIIYNNLKLTLGLEHPQTLSAVFNYFDQLIGLYRLSDCDTLLTEAYPACKKRGITDQYYLKCIQALAFLKFKQHRFDECVKLFEEQKSLMGPCAALLENMGHAYNSTGNSEKAEECFNQALREIESKESTDPTASDEKSNKGGVLLGLGLLHKKHGRYEQALTVLNEGLEWYRSRHRSDHSLVAKSEMYVGETYQKLKKYSSSEEHFRESLRIFRVTCGNESPLTVSALEKLGLLLLEMKKVDEGVIVLQECLKNSVEVDKYSVDVRTFTEILVSLYSTHSNQEGPSKDISMAKNMSFFYVTLCEKMENKLKEKGPLPERDPDLAVFYRTYAEQVFLSGAWQKAGEIFDIALKRFNQIIDIPGCQPHLDFCKQIRDYIISYNNNKEKITKN